MIYSELIMTMEAWVQVQDSPLEMAGKCSGTMVGFLHVLWFALSVIILILHYHLPLTMCVADLIS